MSGIKSAIEIAMEKGEKLDKASDEERLRWTYVPEGERLAAKYLKQDCNLVVEMSQYEENIAKYVIEGASDILIRNISLPKNDLVKSNNRRAMDGLKNLKSDKVGVENVFSQIRHIFNHYVEQGEQQRKQAYESLKTKYEYNIQQAIQQEMGSLMGIKIDVESHPQFQEEWLKMQTQLDAQYLKHLDEYKQELLSIP
jgi:hypothetical protein